MVILATGNSNDFCEHTYVFVLKQIFHLSIKYQYYIMSCVLFISLVILNYIMHIIINTFYCYFSHSQFINAGASIWVEVSECVVVPFTYKIISVGLVK